MAAMLNAVILPARGTPTGWWTAWGRIIPWNVMNSAAVIFIIPLSCPCLPHYVAGPAISSARIEGDGYPPELLSQVIDIYQSAIQDIAEASGINKQILTVCLTCFLMV